MNRPDARKIAEYITNDQLKQMFENAKKNTTDWKQVSYVNKIMTKGTAWNILFGAFRPDGNNHVLGKTNMVREFGEFLPEEFKPKKFKKKSLSITAHHEEPNF